MSFDLKIKNGDLVINQGDLQTVIDNEKLIQDILKICLTSVGSNPLHQWYGSFLTKSIVGTSLDSDVLVQVAKSQLNNCLENLKKLQEAQIKSLQRVSGDELLGGVSDISVLRNEFDPRLFNVLISAITKGFKPITTAFRVSNI